LGHEAANLSEREREVLRLLAQGHDAKSSAAFLEISGHAVNERLREARRKLGVTSSREAARLLIAFEGSDATYKKLVDEKFGIGVPAPADQFDEPARRSGALPLILIGGFMLLALAIAGVSLGPPAVVSPPAVALPPAQPKRSLSTLFDPQDYPMGVSDKDALRSVGIRLGVMANGRASTCAIERSSGNAKLDNATCRILKSRARFVPATASDGSTVPSLYVGTVEWPRS
jgi:DNA-binding CsgD family transcriptional regulator